MGRGPRASRRADLRGRKVSEPSHVNTHKTALLEQLIKVDVRLVVVDGGGDALVVVYAQLRGVPLDHLGDLGARAGREEHRRVVRLAERAQRRREVVPGVAGELVEVDVAGGALAEDERAGVCLLYTSPSPRD